jgi:hypothetical protein
MARRRILDGAAALAVLAAPPAAAAEPAPEPRAPAPSAPSPCAGAAEERSALQAERSALDRGISDIALGRRKKRKAGGGEVAAGVAGAAAAVLLPFGVGALLGVGAKAAARSGRKRKPAAAGPDVPAMIERLDSIDARLAALAGCA